MSRVYMDKLHLQLSMLAGRYSDLLDELEAVKESTQLICDDMSDVVESLYENLALLDDPFTASIKPAAEELYPFPDRTSAVENEA